MKNAMAVQLVGIVAVALCSIGPAHAGEWEVFYNHTTNIQSQYIEVASANPLITKSINNQQKTRLTPQGQITTLNTKTNRSSITSSTQNGGITETAFLSWNGSKAPSPFNLSATPRTGIPPGRASSKKDIRAIFKWKRRQISLNGQMKDDPTDNPPKYLYLLERATISGNQTPGFFTFKSLKNLLSPIPSSLSQAETFNHEKATLTRLAVRGRAQVEGPLRSFGGQINLNTSYAAQEANKSKPANARLEFDYKVYQPHFTLFTHRMANEPVGAESKIMSGAVDNEDHQAILVASIGAPVAGVNIHFEAIDHTAVTSSIPAKLSAADVLTDEDGYAQTVLTSSNTDQEGKVTVKAYILEGVKSEEKSVDVSILLPFNTFGG